MLRSWTSNNMKSIISHTHREIEIERREMNAPCNGLRRLLLVPRPSPRLATNASEEAVVEHTAE